MRKSKRSPSIPRASSTRWPSPGQSILLNANAPNFGAVYRDARRFPQADRSASLTGDAIAARLEEDAAGKIPDGQVNVFGAPPVEGLGTAGGFKIMIEDRGNVGMERCSRPPTSVVAARQRDRQLAGFFTSFRANTPWLFLDIDREAGGDTGRVDGRGVQHLAGIPRLAVRQRFQPLRPHLAGHRPGGAKFRKQPDDINLLQVRNRKGDMVPLGTLLSAKEVSGPVMVDALQHVPGGRRSTATPAPGVSSGQAITLMQQLGPAELNPRCAGVDRVGAACS